MALSRIAMEIMDSRGAPGEWNDPPNEGTHFKNFPRLRLEWCDDQLCVLWSKESNE